MTCGARATCTEMSARARGAMPRASENVDHGIRALRAHMSCSSSLGCE